MEKTDKKSSKETVLNTVTILWKWCYVPPGLRLFNVKAFLQTITISSISLHILWWQLQRCLCVNGSATLHVTAVAASVTGYNVGYVDPAQRYKSNLHVLFLSSLSTSMAILHAYHIITQRTFSLGCVGYKCQEKVPYNQTTLTPVF